MGNINKILNLSKNGYKKNSPDVNNPFNVIPSNEITMIEDDGTPLKKGPILGIGIGNGKVIESKKMIPGENYKFSDYVTHVIEEPLQLGGQYTPKERMGVRQNPDGSVSSHLMMSEVLPNGNWVSFPSLFQNEDGSWADMSEKTSWYPIYLEALKRGEVYNFGKNKEAALEFGRGSWKKEYQTGGQKRLTPQELINAQRAQQLQNKQAQYFKDNPVSPTDEFGNKLKVSGINAPIPTSMADAEGMIQRKEIIPESLASTRAKQARQAEERKQERIRLQEEYAKRQANPEYSSWTGLPGESWRETLAAEGAPMEAMFRFSNEDNFFDDYINPAAWIGYMAKGLGEAPLQAKKTDSYLPYVTSIGIPLLGGAGAGIGAKTTGQFINNTVNPFAGMGDYLTTQTPLRRVIKTDSFKSEIDWGKWNKEIPENKALMQEYNAIEQQAKSNGTWMKNPDGSEFRGTPEQFVQQNSKNFKKAFPNIVKEDDKVIPLIHHSRNKFDSFDRSYNLSGTGAARYGEGVYTIPEPFFKKRIAHSFSDLMDKSNSRDILTSYGNNKYDLYANNVGLNRVTYKNITPVTSSTRYDDIYTVVSPYENRLKSAVGNNGMFDMTNPNIYKALIPAAIATGAAASSNEYKQGGSIPKFQIAGQKRLTPQELIAAQRAQGTGTPQLFNFDPTPEYVGYDGPQPDVSESTSRANNNYVPTQKEVQEAKDYSNYLAQSAENIQKRTGKSFTEAKKDAEALIQYQSQPQATISQLDTKGKDKNLVFLDNAGDAKTIGDYANIAKGVVTNPIDAATAFMSPGGFGRNFYTNQSKVEELMRDGIIDYDKVQSNPMMNVVSMLPYVVPGFGQVAAMKDLYEGASAMYRNPTAENLGWLALDYAGAKAGVSPASNRLLRMQTKKALGNVADYAATQTPLSSILEYSKGFSNIKENIKGFKTLGLLTDPSLVRTAGKLPKDLVSNRISSGYVNSIDDLIADGIPVTPTISKKELRLSLKDDLLKINRLKKLNPDLDLSVWPKGYPKDKNYIDGLADFIIESKNLDKNAKNFGQFFNKQYQEKLKFIDDYPVFKEIVKESPQYTDDIYKHLKNPIKNDAEFIDDLVIQSNTFNRNIHQKLSPEEFMRLRGRSLGHKGNTMDVEGISSSGDYGKYSYRVRPSDERIAQIKAAPIEEKWALRKPSFENTNIELGRGMHGSQNPIFKEFFNKRHLRASQKSQFLDPNLNIYGPQNFPEAVRNNYLVYPSHVVFKSPNRDEILTDFVGSYLGENLSPKLRFLSTSKGYQKGGSITKYQTGKQKSVDKSWDKNNNGIPDRVENEKRREARVREPWEYELQKIMNEPIPRTKQPYNPNQFYDNPIDNPNNWATGMAMGYGTKEDLVNLGVGVVAGGALNRFLAPAINKLSSGLIRGLSMPAVVGGKTIPWLTAGNLLDAYSIAMVPKIAGKTYDAFSEGDYYGGTTGLLETGFYGLGAMNPLLRTQLADDLTSLYSGSKQALNKITTQTPLRDAYKLNPLAPKLGQYNRVVGQDAIDDMIQSGLVRVNDKAGVASDLGPFGIINRTTPYPSFGKAKPQQEYIDQVVSQGKTPYVISTDRPMRVSNLGRHGKGRTQFPINDEGKYISGFPASEAQVYEATPHWLRGYKPVEVPTSPFNTRAQNDLLVEQARRLGEAPLPSYMEPYISRRYTPAAKEQEVFESFLSPEKQAELRKSRTQTFTPKNQYKQGGYINNKSVIARLLK